MNEERRREGEKKDLKLKKEERMNETRKVK